MIDKKPFYLFMFIIWVSAVTGQTMRIKPDLPEIGQEIQLRFNSPPNVRLDTLRAIMYTRINEPPDTLPMTFSGGEWQTSVVIHDTSVSAFYIVLEGNDHERTYRFPDQKPFEQFLYSENGLPAEGAYMTAALMRSGSGHLFEVDLKKAGELLEKELKLYPDNFQARLLSYTLFLRQEGLNRRTAYAIRENVQNILRENESAEALRFALQAYQMIEDEEDAEKIRSWLEKLMPAGERDAIHEFNEIMTLDNPEEQTALLETFIKNYPDSRLNEIALSQLASDVIELNDSTAMVQTGDRLLKKASSMAGASGLSALAGVLSEKDWQLDKADAYIHRAAEIIDRLDPRDHPPEVSDTEWLERIRYTKARYQDIAGWIAFKKGDLDQAFQLLKGAVAVSMEPGILWHYAEVQDALNPEDAIDTYARVAAFGGELGEMAVGRLEDLWNETGRDPAELDSLILSGETEIQAEYHKKLLNEQKTRPAPEFVLNRLNGGQISSSEFKGEKLVLCFWATWSDGSDQLIQALLELDERTDITIIAVAVDRDAAAVSQYVRDHRIPFQVLLANEKTESDFGLRGVPVLFVIDSEYRIQFQHRGFRPDIVEILNVELDYID